MKKILRCALYVQISIFLLLCMFSPVPNTAGAFNPLHVFEPTAFLVQSQISGEWTGEYGKTRLKKHSVNELQETVKTDGLHLNLKRSSDKGTNNFGSNFELSDFQGLALDQVMGNSSVNFSLQREAGTFQFEGNFNNGKGSGRFTLTPNPDFLSAMNDRGYALNEEKQFAAAGLDVKVKTVDDLKAAGFPNLSLDNVFKATIFKITAQFVNEMNSIGFKNLEMEDLVKARIFKVDARFAREVKEMGFGENQPMETWVKMRIFKITPEFLREMRSAGLENLDIEDLVKLKIFKIDLAFIERVRSAASGKLDVEELVRMKIHGKVE